MFGPKTSFFPGVLCLHFPRAIERFTHANKLRSFARRPFDVFKISPLAIDRSSFVINRLSFIITVLPLTPDFLNPSSCLIHTFKPDLPSVLAAQLRQRDRNLQVRKNQARQTQGFGRASRAHADRFRHRRKRRNGPRERAQPWPAKSTSRQIAAMPTTALPSTKKPPPGSCSAISACKLDPATEVNHCIGSKTALAMLPAAFINPGDVTLMTVPGYPVAGTHTKYYGGTVHRLPLTAEEQFFARFEFSAGRCPFAHQAAGAVLPQQPDGQNGHASISTSAVIEFAQQHKIVVIQDAAHGMLSYDQPPVELFERAGTRKLAWRFTPCLRAFT